MKDLTTGLSRQGEETEKGFVLATTALLLIPLMVFAAFAVDIGSWFARAGELQRAADAAALAAVVWMPDEAAATTAALDVASRNGFPDQPGEPGDVGAAYPQVRVTRVANQQVRVEIFDYAESTFGKVFLDGIDISRFAVAEYILPVPMGNPTNAIGTGSDDPFGTGSQANFWLRAMPECESRGTGDLIGSGGGCPTHTNPTYRDEGHTFIVDVPIDGTWVVQARLTCAEFGGAQANSSMRFRFFDADGTPLNDSDNVLVAPLTETTVPRPASSICATNGSNWSRTADPAPWVQIGSVSTAGRYVLQAKNPSYSANIRSLYSIRVVPSTVGTAAGSAWSCTTVGPTASASCPQLYAKDFVTAYTHGQMFPSGTMGLARLHLAEVAEVHAGKRMEIILFDPADGIDSVRVIQPDGTYATLDWHTVDCRDYGYLCSRPDYGSPSAPISQTCGTVSCLRQETGISFQDRTAKIVIDLPANYTCPQPSGQPENCWWMVEYQDDTANANETTTWGVTISGDPVRLTE